VSSTDVRLRLLTRQYAATRDPEIAVRLAEEMVRTGNGEPLPLTFYEVESVNPDSRNSHEVIGAYFTRAQAEKEMFKTMLEMMNDYESEYIHDPDYIGQPAVVRTLRELLSTPNPSPRDLNTATRLFGEHYRNYYSIYERTLPANFD